jgi:hypothetical protein
MADARVADPLHHDGDPVQRPSNCATANLGFHVSRLRGRCVALDLRIQSRDSIEFGFRHLRSQGVRLDFAETSSHPDDSGAAAAGSRASP